MSIKLVASSTIIQFIGRVIGFALSLVSVSFLTRYLGIFSYGEYTTAMSVASLVIAFADFGFFWSTIQNFIEKKDQQTSVREVLGIRISLTLVLIVLSLVMVFLSHYSPEVKKAFLILIVFILASSANNLLVAVYQAEYKMLWPTLTEIAARLATLILIIVGIISNQNLWWFVFGPTLTATLNMSLNWIGLNRQHGSLKPKFFNFSWKAYYQSVFLVGLMSLFSFISSKFDIIILSWIRSSIDVGIYGIAQKVVELSVVFQSLFTGALFPLLIAKFKEGREGMIVVINKGFLILTAIGLPLSVYGFMLARPLIKVISGQEFVDRATITFIHRPITAPVIISMLFLFVLLAYLGSVFNVGLLASGRVKRLIVVNVIATVINIVLNFSLIPHYSYLAAAGVAVMTQAIIMFSNAYYFFTHYRYRPNWLSLLLIVVCVIPGIVLIKLLPNLNFFFTVIIVTIIYSLGISVLLPQVRKTVIEFVRRREVL